MELIVSQKSNEGMILSQDRYNFLKTDNGYKLINVFLLSQTLR